MTLKHFPVVLGEAVTGHCRILVGVTPQTGILELQQTNPAPLAKEGKELPIMKEDWRLSAEEPGL